MPWFEKGLSMSEKGLSMSSEKDVLFQKIGNTWFLITEINGQVMFTKLDKDPHTNKIDIIAIN